MSEEPPRSSRPTAALFLKRNPPVGARPGALALPEDSPPPRVRVIAYGRDAIQEVDVDAMAEIRPLLERFPTTWIDVQGLGDEKVLQELANLFAIHPLALADVVNLPQRPKTESYEGQQLFICGTLRIEDDGQLVSEQLSLFIGQRYVLTFQERYGDSFEPIRRRLREGAGLLRTSGADHLGYALIDTVVDAYYPMLETFADRIEELEASVMRRPHPGVLTRIHDAKRTLMLVRRAVWPLRDALGTLIRDPVPLVTDSARVYLRDTYDHCIQAAEMAESYRELVSELTNAYLSAISNRTNDVMRVLTVVTTVFIPLTFIVGVYGMNFDHMPELHWQWGYFLTLGVMLGLAIGMLIYFRRRGWLGTPRDDLDLSDEEEGPEQKR